jgi:hypothetical protein
MERDWEMDRRIGGQGFKFPFEVSRFLLRGVGRKKPHRGDRKARALRLHETNAARLDYLRFILFISCEISCKIVRDER